MKYHAHQQIRNTTLIMTSRKSSIHRAPSGCRNCVATSGTKTKKVCWMEYCIINENFFFVWFWSEVLIEFCCCCRCACTPPDSTKSWLPSRLYIFTPTSTPTQILSQWIWSKARVSSWSASCREWRTKTTSNGWRMAQKWLTKQASILRKNHATM